MIKLEQHVAHKTLPTTRWNGRGASQWIEGVGIHTGVNTRVRFHAAPGEPVCLLRDGVQIPLLAEYVRNTQLATEIAFEDSSVSTTEHLLAALYILGHWSGFTIEVEGPEVPILDGSALGWAWVLQDIEAETAPAKLIVPEIAVESRGGYVGLESVAPGMPSAIQVSVSFANPAIQDQRWQGDERSWDQLLDARTFGFARDLERMWASGRGLGATEDNVVLYTENGSSNLPLRGHDEAVRHKALDLLGDLYLVGCPLAAMVVGERNGHAANIALALELREGL